MDRCDHVRPDALDELLQDQIFVVGLDLGGEDLDAVEVGAVGHVEDGRDPQSLAGRRDLLRLLHTEVVHEDGELPASGPLGQEVHEAQEVGLGDGFILDLVCFEAAIIADGAQQGLDLD